MRDLMPYVTVAMPNIKLLEISSMVTKLYLPVILKKKFFLNELYAMISHVLHQNI